MGNDSIQEEVRNLIWDVREKWDISTFELAARLDVSWSTIKTWELMEAVTVGPPGSSHTLDYAPPTAEQIEKLKQIQSGGMVA